MIDNMPLAVTEVCRYLIKSCRGERLRDAVVEPWGLAGDRRWMIVDAAGDPVTARDFHQMLLITPRMEGDALRLTAPSAPELIVKLAPDAERVPVDIWGSGVRAVLAGDEAALWLSDLIGEPVRLVFLDDPAQRQVDRRYSRDGDRVSFADQYPLLLTSEESLGELNGWIAAGPLAAEGPVPMTRFRPNVVVAGAAPWAEDGWRQLRIGDVIFRAVKGCDRCVMTTVDPVTAAGGKEPIATLARYRRWDGKVWFGVNLIPDPPPDGAVIRPGDPVEVLS
jgi:uncharacterized protein